MWKIKLTIYFKGGNKLSIKCDSFECSRLTNHTDNRSLYITGADKDWTIDIYEIVAITSKRVLTIF